MRIRPTWEVARTRQRLREFACVFEQVPRGALGVGLELGGGDGFMASLLRPYCTELITTDSYAPRLAASRFAREIPRVVCNATSLPFAAGTFDFIFSSSLLEHIRDRATAYAEMSRCLRPGGFMIHIMPSRTWKLLQLALYYPNLLVAGIDLLLDATVNRRKLRDAVPAEPPPPAPPAQPAHPAPPAEPNARWSDDRWKPSLRAVLRGIFPTVHGEYPGHLSELRHFGRAPWIAELRAAGFEVHHILGLPLYSGYGFGLEAMRRLGERRLSLSSHNAFVIGRPSAPPDLFTALSAGTPPPMT